jgi:hypothetical protein
MPRPQVNTSKTAASTGTSTVHDKTLGKALIRGPPFMIPGFHSSIGAAGNCSPKLSEPADNVDPWISNSN